MFDHEIEEICKFAFSFSTIDTIFIDPLSQIKSEYGHNQVPEPLKESFGNIHSLLNLHDLTSELDVIFHSSSYKINFISAKLYRQEDYMGSIVVGPFLFEEPTYRMIHDILFSNKFSISLSHIMEQFYLSLPLISSYKAKTIAEFLAYLASNFNRADTASRKKKIGSINYSLQSEYPTIPDTIKMKSKPSISAIEERYRTQNELMSSVETGNKAKVEKIMNEDMYFFGKIPDRIPNDPLRSRKNLAFVTNTLLRISAERGGLHPVYIDSISEKFAIQIEKTSTIQQLVDLQMKMCFDYCDAVKKLSLKNFNRLIRKAIEFIRLNLDHDLRLDTIATAVQASSYELSRQFKKETGKSITEYINQQRINEAIKIMENENLSITDIASLVGFNDVNYFTKVFKKMNGITPSEYRHGLDGVRHR
ncbi:helix-turn-helix domain-containing protein [Bacillus sp. sid0103]|uniref:helix-turn-helix domain-containing protein n=1 Tax=Bacillus sp. sid0103 TaxID=2856337 RepID=UPI001C445E4E|nr:helix-turn-helix domain-containing protein [Bacillus sp. sid0103]MBV7509186.1 helix-turn-helix domain-containing protein [Bacillus sp. sid0103]